MFFIDKNTVLTPELLEKFINRFIINEQPKLRRWDNYYRGKHDILQKTYSDSSKPCARIVTNFCKIVTDVFAGYIVGKPVCYTSSDDITEVQNTINYNDSSSEDMRFIKNALVFANSYELFWLDTDAQVRFNQVSPLCAFPIYDNSLDNELLYFVRWYKVDSFDDNNNYYLEVYDSFSKKTYKMNGQLSSLEFIAEEPHYFNDVPVSVFKLNDEEDNIFSCIMSLNDAYNELQSSSVNDYSALVDSLLVLTGCDMDANDMALMKSNRLLLLPEGASAQYVVRNSNDVNVANISENIKKNIYKVTNAPDMTDDAFLAQSGTALSYKLVGFENVAGAIIGNMKRALQRRIELICNILQLKASDAIWRDIDISFTRNLPTDLTSTLQAVQALQGIVSNETLLSQIPFIDSPSEEIVKVNAEKEANMALYSFGLEEDEEDGE